MSEDDLPPSDDTKYWRIASAPILEQLATPKTRTELKIWVRSLPRKSGADRTSMTEAMVALDWLLNRGLAVRHGVMGGMPTFVAADSPVARAQALADHEAELARQALVRQRPVDPFEPVAVVRLEEVKPATPLMAVRRPVDPEPDPEPAPEPEPEPESKLEQEPEPEPEPPAAPEPQEAGPMAPKKSKELTEAEAAAFIDVKLASIRTMRRKDVFAPELRSGAFYYKEADLRAYLKRIGKPQPEDRQQADEPEEEIEIDSPLSEKEVDDLMQDEDKKTKPAPPPRSTIRRPQPVPRQASADADDDDDGQVQSRPPLERIRILLQLHKEQILNAEETLNVITRIAEEEE